MKTPYLYITVFMTGAAILVIEILGARVISPYFGASLYVWSSLITVTLVSLAVGYWRGGIIADSSPDGGRLYSIIFESAVYLAATPYIKSFIMNGTSSLDIRLGALLSAFALFFLPLTFLSMVTPYAIRMAVGRIEDVGKTTGILYAASTIGSLTGAILAGFVLIPLFHVDKIVYIISITLALLAAVPWILERKPLKVAAAATLIVVCLVSAAYSGQLSQAGELKVIYTAGSPYGDIKVVDGNSRRTLLLSGVAQGQMEGSGRPVNRYSYFMDALMQAYTPDARDALVLGLGMGAIPKILKERGIKVDSVEIDPVVADAARSFFGFDDKTGRLYIEDGRYFIENTANSYDCIFMDTYASDAIPYHLFSVESFSAMKKLLNEDGMLAINFHDYSDPQKAVTSQSILKTLRMTFKDVLVFEIEPWHDRRYRNIAFIASNNGLIPRGVPHDGFFRSGVPSPINIGMDDGVALTDGYNPIETMYAPLSVNTREKSRKAFPGEILG